MLGTAEGRRVAFLPRRGRGHRIPPYKINYRANPLGDPVCRCAPDPGPLRGRPPPARAGPGHPEAVPAREPALGYAAVALLTDLDAGIDATESVAQEEVFTVFAFGALVAVALGLPFDCIAWVRRTRKRQAARPLPRSRCSHGVRPGDG